MLAAVEGNAAIVRILLQAGADPNRKNGNRQSAVDNARKTLKRCQRYLAEADESNREFVEEMLLQATEAWELLRGD